MELEVGYEVHDESLVEVGMTLDDTTAIESQEAKDVWHGDNAYHLEPLDDSQDEIVDRRVEERRMKRRPPSKSTYDNPGIHSYLQYNVTKDFMIIVLNKEKKRLFIDIY